MPSKLQATIDFFREFGLFDVILPFLLVFTLVFAILEKTRVLGTESDGKTPKRNLNAVVGFVVGLLVVATARVVSIINEALPNIVILLVSSISFLILIGTFIKSGEFDFSEKHPGWYKFFLWVMFVAVVLVFLGAIRLNTGQSVLNYIIDYLISQASGTVVGSIVILVIIIVAIYFIMYEKGEGKSKKD